MRTGMKMWLAALTAVAVIGFVQTSEAASLSAVSRRAVLRDLRSVRADHWEMSGKNLIVRGNVHVPAGDYEIRADEAVINSENHDFDARGNLELVFNQNTRMAVTVDQLEEWERRAGVKIDVLDVVTDVYGEQKINISVRRNTGRIRAASLSGNLDTGVFPFF